MIKKKKLWNRRKKIKTITSFVCFYISIFLYYNEQQKSWREEKHCDEEKSSDEEQICDVVEEKNKEEKNSLKEEQKCDIKTIVLKKKRKM